MHRVQKLISGGDWAGGIVKLEAIKRICPLAPVILDECDPAIWADTCFDKVNEFYLNRFDSHDTYLRLS